MESRAAETAVQSRPRGRIRIVAVVALILALLSTGWFVAGNLRAESIARDYFIHAHSGVTVENVTVDHVRVALPPFWEIQVSGDVIEAGRTAPSYRGVMWIWVEPITGYAFVNGAG